MPRHRKPDDQGTQQPVGPETADLAFMKDPKTGAEWVRALTQRGQALVIESLGYPGHPGVTADSPLVLMVPGSIEIIAIAAQVRGYRTRFDSLVPGPDPDPNTYANR